MRNTPTIDKPISLNLPYPHPGQIAVRQQAKRFNWGCMGRRWRKTTNCMSISVEDALNGQQIVWTSHVYNNVAIGWDECIKGCDELIKNRVIQFNQSKMTGFFPNGGRIIFRSLEDPDNVRGLTADKIIIDEAPEVDERAWYEVLRPMLMDTGGDLWAIGTGKGHNWFWKEHQLAKTRPDSMSWQIPTVGCEIVYDEKTGQSNLVRKPHPLENPEIKWEEIVDMFHSMSERAFRQEVMAEFIEDSGGVFHNVDRAIMTGVNRNTDPQPGKAYQMGVDVARKHDFTVITVFELPSLRQVYFERFNKISWNHIYNRIAAVAKLYRSRSILDTTGVGETVPDELRRRGVSIVMDDEINFSGRNKITLIDHFASLIEHCPYPFLMDIPQQTFELKAYQYMTTDNNNLKMGAPKGEGNFDDCVISPALGCWGKRHPIREASNDREPIIIRKGPFQDESRPLFLW